MSKKPRRLAIHILSEADFNRITWVEKKSQNVEEKDIGTPIDLLFIDGDHRYEGAKADWERFSRWMRPGGLVVMHDIVSRKVKKGSECGVWRVWNEITWPKFALEEGRPGIGFVRVPRG